MKREFCLGSAIGLGVLSFSAPVLAQISSDGTLPIPTVVPPSVNGNDFLINNGTRSGNNLFHSFSQFSVPTKGSAIFNNATDVQNIFSRVTGSQLSNIDGILKTQGNANLFLMNPNGIIFGPNAQLQLGGSFLGTTANSIKFGDGIEFDTVNATPALLSVKVPIGLQMGSTSGSIQVQGSGHTLVNARPTVRATSYVQQQGSLKVSPGNTLALIGNNIQLSGGILTAENGQVALGSVGNSTIEINTTTPQWGFSYNEISNFSDIQLTNAALLDTTGSAGGSIQIQGKTVQIQNSSLLFIQTQGAQNAGSISIHADVLELSGALPNRDRSLNPIGKDWNGEGH
jgi:filamentous hemagglutinin family protein